MFFNQAQRPDIDLAPPRQHQVDLESQRRAVGAGAVKWKVKGSFQERAGYGCEGTDLAQGARRIAGAIRKDIPHLKISFPFHFPGEDPPFHPVNHRLNGRFMNPSQYSR